MKRRLLLQENSTLKNLLKRVKDGNIAVWQHDHRMNSDQLKEYAAKMKKNTVWFKKYGCITREEKKKAIANIDKSIGQRIAKGHGIITISKRQLGKTIIKAIQKSLCGSKKPAM